MRLVASMNTHNELGRYLRLTIPRLLQACDEIRIQDDHSTDGTFEWLSEQEGVVVKRNEGTTWRENEGELHQQLLDWTLEASPTHILAVDADEWLTYPEPLREMIAEGGASVWTLRMCEVWSIDPWLLRIDGGWVPHPVGILYSVEGEPVTNPEWRIWGRKMAGGRVPRIVRKRQRHRELVRELPIDLLHLGWANPAEREARYQRYVELDGGQFHAGAHLESIMWPDERVGLLEYPKRHHDALPTIGVPA